MASAPRHLRVFLASPGDVVDEREIALAVLDDLPYDPLLRGKVTIEGVAWDKRGAGAPILAGLTPQDSIAAGLPRPGECDIVVVIFWSRIGTPLPESYRKNDGSRYESGTEWEYEDAVDGFRKHDSPFVLLYRRKQKVLLDADDPDFESRHDQYEKVRQFFARLRSSDGSAASGHTEYGTPGDFRGQLEHDLKSLISRILEKQPAVASSPGAVPKPWPGSPFPGLRAFTADDAPIFFGREREIDTLLDRVASHRFVAVVGASGSGKSSLVAAGAIPRLQLAAGSTGAPERLILQFTPDRLGTGDPFASLAAAMLTAMPDKPQKGLATKLREDPDLLGLSLRRPAFVFIDQFEELFTTVHESLRAPFADLLERLTVVDDVRIVITLRADFYGKCVEMQTLARLVEHSTVPLSAPGAVALSDMITRPAARAALTFESGLPDRILEDTGHEPGALALMAYVLDEIYRHRLGLTHAAYEELGGVQGAIGKRSETVFSTLGDDEKAALPRVFRELVEVDDRGSATRLRAPVARVAATPSARRLTEALTDARLLVQSRGENHEPMVEVAHEALFRSWSRLAEWIADTADDLRVLHHVRRAAAEWDRNGRRDDFLWSHERLAPVYSLRDRTGVDFDETVAAFIRPEYERLADRIRRDTREFRQRSDVERLIEIGAPAAPALVHSIQYASTEATRKAIADALLALGDVAVQALLEACAADSFANRQVVLDMLVTLKTLPSKEVVRRLMEDEAPAVRATAIHLAATTVDVAAVPAIIRRFDDPVEEIRILATLAVATFDDDQAFEALAAALGNDHVANLALEIVEYFMVGHKRLLLPGLQLTARGSEIAALVRKNRAALSPRRAEIVASVLASPGFSRSTSALRILVRIGNTTAIHVALNAMRLNTKNVLSLISREAGPEFVSALIESLNASESQTRRDAARVARHVFLFSDRLRDIVETQWKNDLSEGLLRLAHDEDRSVSDAAVSALAAIRSLPARPFFRAHLAPNDPLRLVSIEALGRMGDASDVPALIAALRDPHRRVRMTAVSALQALGAEKEAATEALSLLESIADSPDEGSFQATLIGIVMVAPPAGATAVLNRIAKSQGAHRVATEALARLRKSATR